MNIQFQIVQDLRLPIWSLFRTRHTLAVTYLIRSWWMKLREKGLLQSTRMLNASWPPKLVLQRLHQSLLGRHRSQRQWQRPKVRVRNGRALLTVMDVMMKMEVRMKVSPPWRDQPKNQRIWETSQLHLVQSIWKPRRSFSMRIFIAKRASICQHKLYINILSKSISSISFRLGWKKSMETASLATTCWKSSQKLCCHKFVEDLASFKCTSRNNQCWPLALIPSTLCRSYRWKSSDVFKNLLRDMGMTEAKRRSYIPKTWTDADCRRVFGPVNVDWNLNYLNPNLRHLELFKTYWLMNVIRFQWTLLKKIYMLQIHHSDLDWWRCRVGYSKRCKSLRWFQFDLGPVKQCEAVETTASISHFLSNMPCLHKSIGSARQCGKSFGPEWEGQNQKTNDDTNKHVFDLANREHPARSMPKLVEISWSHLGVQVFTACEKIGLTRTCSVGAMQYSQLALVLSCLIASRGPILKWNPSRDTLQKIFCHEVVRWLEVCKVPSFEHHHWGLPPPEDGLHLLEVFAGGSADFGKVFGSPIDLCTIYIYIYNIFYI